MPRISLLRNLLYIFYTWALCKSKFIFNLIINRCRYADHWLDMIETHLMKYFWQPFTTDASIYRNKNGTLLSKTYRLQRNILVLETLNNCASIWKL